MIKSGTVSGFRTRERNLSMGTGSDQMDPFGYGYIAYCALVISMGPEQ